MLIYRLQRDGIPLFLKAGPRTLAFPGQRVTSLNTATQLILEVFGFFLYLHMKLHVKDFQIRLHCLIFKYKIYLTRKYFKR